MVFDEPRSLGQHYLVVDRPMLCDDNGSRRRRTVLSSLLREPTGLIVCNTFHFFWAHTALRRGPDTSPRRPFSKALARLARLGGRSSFRPQGALRQTSLHARCWVQIPLLVGHARSNGVP